MLLKDNTRNKFGVFLGLLIVVTIGGFLFIKFSNDHKECSRLKEITIDKNGNEIVSEKHICKEKYSF